MDFPISDVVVNPLLLVVVGFLVGVLGGFFGVGGGFIAGPFLFWTGMPLNMVVGTDLAHMTGKSIVAARRHRTLGQVDLKLGFYMVAGTVVGVEIGAQMIEVLEEAGRVDIVVGLAYVIILVLISVFTGWESIKAIQLLDGDNPKGRGNPHGHGANHHGDVLAFQSLSRRVQGIQLKPMVSFPNSNIPSISVWVILAVGVITGVLAGFLGVGGGFIRMPMLIYIIGVPTHVAVGTDLFEIVISAGFGTITHALKGNVDILIALVMQTGAAVGAQIGAVSTRFFAGPRIRLWFAFLPLLGAILVALRLLGFGEGL